MTMIANNYDIIALETSSKGRKKKKIKKNCFKFVASWIKKWCRHQSTRLSRKEEVAVLRISARRGNTKLPVNRPLRFFKGKFLDRVNRCIADQPPRQRSVLPLRKRNRTTTRIRIPHADSIPRGEDLRNCRITPTRHLSRKLEAQMQRFSIFLKESRFSILFHDSNVCNVKFSKI